MPVLGSDDELAARAAEVGADHFVVAIGGNATRGAVLTRAVAAAAARAGDHRAPVGGDRPRRHGGRGLDPARRLGGGNDTQIGRGALLGIRSSIDHDGVLGDHPSLGPGATTGGTVRIGSTTAIGSGRT